MKPELFGGVKKVKTYRWAGRGRRAASRGWTCRPPRPASWLLSSLWRTWAVWRTACCVRPRLRDRARGSAGSCSGSSAPARWSPPGAPSSRRPPGSWWCAWPRRRRGSTWPGWRPGGCRRSRARRRGCRTAPRWSDTWSRPVKMKLVKFSSSDHMWLLISTCLSCV